MSVSPSSLRDSIITRFVAQSLSRQPFKERSGQQSRRPQPNRRPNRTAETHSKMATTNLPLQWAYEKPAFPTSIRSRPETTFYDAPELHLTPTLAEIKAALLSHASTLPPPGPLFTDKYMSSEEAISPMDDDVSLSSADEEAPELVYTSTPKVERAVALYMIRTGPALAISISIPARARTSSPRPPRGSSLASPERKARYREHSILAPRTAAPAPAAAQAPTLDHLTHSPSTDSSASPPSTPTAPPSPPFSFATYSLSNVAISPASSERSISPAGYAPSTYEPSITAKPSKKLGLFTKFVRGFGAKEQPTPGPAEREDEVRHRRRESVFRPLSPMDVGPMSAPVGGAEERKGSLFSFRPRLVPRGADEIEPTLVLPAFKEEGGLRRGRVIGRKPVGGAVVRRASMMGLN
ncbi:hypothetical protein EJ06DRAFT_547347 [Trichodelitschia bisporula]|uniref:Uncharacterized protein n=1 Tax=Trichodelitschia bisporula TaxID=703511 RepID=A0A6G1I4V6_9PEZI|nr:hypothetical protein EJ06DRAFT_547347 [Trichodelitschia bisporula]